MWFGNEIYNQERQRDFLREAEHRNLVHQAMSGNCPPISLFRRGLELLTQGAHPMRMVGRGMARTNRAVQESDSAPCYSSVS